MTDTAGSSRSFEQLAAEVSPRLLQFLQRMVGDAQLAEDLLQETLMKVARGLPMFRGGSSYRTWMFSIATRVVADHFRRPEARAGIVELEDDDVVPDHGPDVGERAVIDEMNSCVRGVIDGLPPDHRSALVLHDLQGMTVAETAATCGCSLATAKIRIHRGRRRLKQALAQECTFYYDRQNALRCDRSCRNGDRGSTGGADSPASL